MKKKSLHFQSKGFLFFIGKTLIRKNFSGSSGRMSRLLVQILGHLYKWIQSSLLVEIAGGTPRVGHGGTFNKEILG